jgi:hypothetical protein
MAVGTAYAYHVEAGIFASPVKVLQSAALHEGCCARLGRETLGAEDVLLSSAGTLAHDTRLIRLAYGSEHLHSRQRMSNLIITCQVLTVWTSKWRAR